jgi:hypothetical protein
MDNLRKADDRHRAAASGDAPAFLPEGAFVVQLRTGTANRGDALVGRVEHVVSGRATHFESPADLLAFMREALQRHPSLVEDAALAGQGRTGASGKL